MTLTITTVAELGDVDDIMPQIWGPYIVVIAVVAEALGPAVGTYVLSLFDNSAREKLAEQLLYEHGVLDTRQQLEEPANWLWSEGF